MTIPPDLRTLFLVSLVLNCLILIPNIVMLVKIKLDLRETGILLRDVKRLHEQAKQLAKDAAALN